MVCREARIEAKLATWVVARARSPMVCTEACLGAKVA